MICNACGLYSAALWRGACEGCNSLRLQAANEFMRAADAVRILEFLGARIIARHRRPPAGRSRLGHAIARTIQADKECVRLGLWKSERSTKRPPWFYGDERSNTA